MILAADDGVWIITRYQIIPVKSSKNTTKQTKAIEGI